MKITSKEVKNDLKITILKKILQPKFCPNLRYTEAVIFFKLIHNYSTFFVFKYEPIKIHGFNNNKITINRFCFRRKNNLTYRFPHSLHMTKVVMGSSAERVWSWL
jgi:hypothetical protein